MAVAIPVILMKRRRFKCVPERRDRVAGQVGPRHGKSVRFSSCESLIDRRRRSKGVYSANTFCSTSGTGCRWARLNDSAATRYEDLRRHLFSSAPPIAG